MHTVPARTTFLAASALLALALASPAASLVLEGRIVPPDGRPIDQYMVCVEFHEGQFQTPPSDFRLAHKPDADGSFRIEVPPHNNQYWLYVQDRSGRALIGFPHLHASRDFGAIELRDDGALMGMLHTPDNTPAANVHVLLERKLEARCRHYVSAGSMHTDDQGSFAFDQLHPGEYSLRIEADQYTHAATEVEVTEDVTYMELQLAPAASIRGRVTLSDGTPVAGISVQSRGRTAPATTDAEGRYHLGGLGPDTYSLLARSETHAPKHFAPLSVVLEREDVIAPDIIVWPLGTLRVTLTSKPDKPLPSNLSIELEARGERFHRFPFEAPLQDGVAFFEGLPLGDFQLRLSDETLGDASSKITIKSDGITELTIELPEVFTLHGRAVDDDGNPLEGVRAVYNQTPSHQAMFSEAFSDSSTVSRYARSDTDGRFSLKGLPAGEGSLAIVAENRVPHNATIELPLESDEERLFTLSKGLSVMVRIVDDAGSPIPGVTLTLRPDPSLQPHQMSHQYGRSARGESDVDGQVTLQALQAGKYQLSFDAPEHYGVFDPIEITDQTERLDDLVLQRGQTITGTLTNADGTPVTGAWLFAHTMSASLDQGSHVSRNVETDENGAFRIGGLPDARVHITFHDGESYEELSQISDVPAGSDDLMVILAPQRSIPLKAVTPDGSPIAGATVTIELTGRRYMMHFDDTDGNKTDSNGVTTILVREGRRYAVGLRLRPWVDTYHILDLSEGRAAPELIEITMQMGLMARGTVTGADGAPLAGVYVTAADRETAQTDAHGVFQIPGIGPGVLVLYIHADADLEQLLGMHRMFVEDTATDMIEAHITLPVPGSIRGTVRNADGEPFPEAMVILNNMAYGYSEHISSQQIFTDSAGAFTFEAVIPGSYMLVAMKADGSHYTTSRTMRMIEISAGQDIVADLPESTGAGESVSGRITRNGEPLPEVGVIFVPLGKDGQMDMMAAMSRMGREPIGTDENGRYIANNLQPGQYIVIVAEDDSAHPLASQDWQRTIPVSIEEGQSELDISINSVTLRGTITGTDGAPADGVKLFVAPSSLGLMMRGMMYHTAETDANGRFEIEDLATGTYGIAAIDDAREEAVTMTIELVEDTTGEFAIQLDPGQRISGSARLEPEGRLENAFVLAFSEDGILMGGESIDDDGTFKLEHVLPQGRYFVACLHQDLVAPGKFVEAGPDSTLTFVLRPGGDVTVTLTGDNDQIVGRTLRITDADDNEIHRLTSSFDMGYMANMTRSLSLLPTDEDGRTTIYGLPTGIYTIALVDTDLKATVTVRPFAESTLDLELP